MDGRRLLFLSSATLATALLGAIGTEALVAQEPLAGPPPEVIHESQVIHLTLEEAQQLALANNLKLNMARLNVREKMIAVAAARTDFFPKLLGLATYIHFNDDLGTVLTLDRLNQQVNVNVVNQDTAVGVLMVAQPITKLIAVDAAVSLARADVGIARAQMDQGTGELLSGVAQLYYGIVAARRIQNALSLQIRMAEQLLPPNPPPQARLGLLEARKGLVDANTQIVDLNAQLVSLLGLPPCTDVDLVEPPPPPMPVACADEAVELALVNNPQARQAQAQIQQARAGLQVARMECLPDVNLFGAYVGQTAADYIQEDFGLVAVEASYTFVDWGKRRHVQEQRRTQIALAQRNQQATIEQVQLDTRAAYSALDKARQDLEIAQEVVEAYRELEAGAADMAAIAAAKGETFKAELELMKADLTYRLAHAKLSGMIGLR
jgi:outer membrane protein TolC